MELEILEGKLIYGPEYRITNTGKEITKIVLETDDEAIAIVAWGNVAVLLNECNEGDVLKIEGYRKYNDYIKKEEFAVLDFEKQ